MTCLVLTTWKPQSMRTSNLQNVLYCSAGGVLALARSANKGYGGYPTPPTRIQKFKLSESDMTDLRSLRSLRSAARSLRSLALRTGPLRCPLGRYRDTSSHRRYGHAEPHTGDAAAVLRTGELTLPAHCVRPAACLPPHPVTTHTLRCVALTGFSAHLFGCLGCTGADAPALFRS